MIITNQSTKKIAVVSLAAAILLAILGLISYIPELRVLSSVRSYYIPMPPSSAIAFLLLSAILILYIFGFWRGVRRFYGLTLLAIVTIYSFLVFAEYFFKIDVNFETYIFKIDESINEIPVGIMSAYAAIMFFLAAIIMILLILNANRKKHSNVLGHSSGILGSILFVSSSVFILSYLFQNPFLYNLKNTVPVAFTTAIAFLFFAVALIIAVGVNYFPMSFFIGPYIRNRLLRIFIPLTVSIVIIQSFLYEDVINIYPINNVLLVAISVICFAGLAGLIVFRFTSIIGNRLDKAEVALQESEERYRTLFNTSQEGIIIMEIETNKFKYVNPGICKIFGYTEKELVVMDNKTLHPKDYSSNANLQDRIIGINSPAKDVPYLRKDGTIFYADINSATIVIDGQKCVAGFFHDITERKKTQEEILYLSYHDHLTGLYNRRFFQEEQKRLDTKRQLPISIIMADVDGLKYVNDNYGHEKGDKLLITVSEIIKNSCRQEDIIARIGGDEFIIFLPKTTEADALDVTDRIRKTSKIYKLEDKINISISLGLSTKNDLNENINHIIEQADKNMYADKASKKNNTDIG